MLGVSKVWGTIYIIILIYQLKPEWMLQWIISRKPKIILINYEDPQRLKVKQLGISFLG